ncbi:MAG: hypothetical protein KF897_03625 [Opitutaceae bacterium]|nr:hypothetical protein [Opitutaceae bacterium]
MAKRTSEPKEPRVGVRLTEEQRARLDKIHALYGSSDSAVVSALVDAWCDHVVREGKVRFPIRVEVDEARADAIVAELAQAAYTTKGAKPVAR